GPIPSVPVFFVLSGPRVHRALRSFPTRRSSDLMRKCYEDGISIPRDLSVVGFDDIRLAQFMLPPLTTVQMSQAELARLAFDALLDRKSTRLNSSHLGISYAVFCLKKKNHPPRRT